MNGGLATNGNRAARRAVGPGQARPYADLAVTRLGPFVYLGFRGAGFGKLTPNQARAVATALFELADRNPEELAP